MGSNEQLDVLSIMAAHDSKDDDDEYKRSVVDVVAIRQRTRDILASHSSVPEKAATQIHAIRTKNAAFRTKVAAVLESALALDTPKRFAAAFDVIIAHLCKLHVEFALAVAHAMNALYAQVATMHPGVMDRFAECFAYQMVSLGKGSWEKWEVPEEENSPKMLFLKRAFYELNVLSCVETLQGSVPEQFASVFFFLRGRSHRPTFLGAMQREWACCRRYGKKGGAITSLAI